MGALSGIWPCVIAVGVVMILTVLSFTSLRVAVAVLRLVARMYVADPALRRASLEQWTADLHELRRSERSRFVASLLSIGVWRLMTNHPERRRVVGGASASVMPVDRANGLARPRVRYPVLGRLGVAIVCGGLFAASLEATSSAPDVRSLFGFASVIAWVQPSPATVFAVGTVCAASPNGGTCPAPWSMLTAESASLHSGHWSTGIPMYFGVAGPCQSVETTTLVHGTPALVVTCGSGATVRQGTGTPAGTDVLVLTAPYGSASQPNLVLGLTCPLSGWHLDATRLVLDLSDPDSISGGLVRSTVSYSWFNGEDAGLFTTAANGSPNLFSTPAPCAPAFFGERFWRSRFGDLHVVPLNR
jgi:hypothetical protein